MDFGGSSLSHINPFGLAQAQGNNYNQSSHQVGVRLIFNLFLVYPNNEIRTPKNCKFFIL